MDACDCDFSTLSERPLKESCSARLRCSKVILKAASQARSAESVCRVDQTLRNTQNSILKSSPVQQAGSSSSVLHAQEPAIHWVYSPLDWKPYHLVSLLILRDNSGPFILPISSTTAERSNVREVPSTTACTVADGYLREKSLSAKPSLNPYSMTIKIKSSLNKPSFYR